MRRRTATVFAAILFAGFVLPYFVWDNYLTIFTFHDQVKGNIYDTVAAVALVVPFTIGYCGTSRGDSGSTRRIGSGWSLVPFAMFVGIKMRVARHLLIVLLVPDKRGPRNIATVAHRPRAPRGGAGGVPTRVGALHYDGAPLRIPGALSAENRLGNGSRRREASAAHGQAAAVGAPAGLPGGIVSGDGLACGPDAGHRLLGRYPARVSPHHRLPRPAPHRTGASPAGRPRNILFIQLAEMGTMVVAYPSLRKARELYPDATLHFLCFAQIRSSVEILEIIDPRTSSPSTHIRAVTRARHAAVSVASAPSPHRHRDQHGSLRQGTAAC